MGVIAGFLDQLARGPVLFDGAMGSLLIAAGLEPGSAPEAWNVERPEVIGKIHREYLDAGAEVITTNTFGGSPLRLSAHKLDSRCVELNFAAVGLAMAARLKSRDRRIFIAGGMGPCGKFFPPVGGLTESALADSAKTQVEVLAAAAVDLILIETMVDVHEAEIAVRTARQLTDVPVIVTMTFDKKPRGYFTIMGNTPSDAVRRLADAGADVVGANCTLAADQMVELTEMLASASPVPILIQPNAGQPEMIDGRAIYRVDPGQFASAIQRIIGAGAAAVGGCCGTTPEHIRAVATLIGPVR
jgi:methionine synthase I (cobalamin-dependent)